MNFLLTFVVLLHFVAFHGQCDGSTGIGFVDSLMIAIENLKSSFTYAKKGSVDDEYIAKEIKSKNQSSITIMNSIAICSIHGVPCDYLQCLTENFRHNQMSLNAKKLGHLMVDPDLRHVILDNESVLKLACNMSNLNQYQCLAFKEFLNLMDLLDPPESHINDEPRDKRSVKTPNSDVGHFNLSKSNSSDQDTVYDYYDGIHATKNLSILNATSVAGNIGGEKLTIKNCTKLLPQKSLPEKNSTKTSTRKTRRGKNLH